MTASRVVAYVLVAFVVTFSGVAPAAAQSSDGTMNVSDVASELRGELGDDQEIRQVLDADTVAESVEWDAENDTARIQIRSTERQTITIVDSVRYEEEGQVERQSYQVQDGVTTIDVDAWHRGRQVLDVGTDSTLTRLESAPELDVLLRVYWFVPAAIAIILIFYFTLRGVRKDRRERGTKVWDFKQEQYHTVVHRRIAVDTSTWWGRIKYRVLSLKEQLLDFYYGGSVRSSVLLLAAAFLVDRLAFNGQGYYLIASDPELTKIALITVPIAVPSAWVASHIVTWLRDDYEHTVMVAHDGDLEDDSLPEYDDVQEFIENYEASDEQGYRWLGMDDEVYSRFERLLDEDLTTKQYADGDEVKIARMVDLENNKILPDPAVLDDSAVTKARNELVERNNQILRRFKEQLNLLTAAAPLIEDHAKEQAHVDVAETWDDALNASDDGSVSGVINELTSFDADDVDAGSDDSTVLDDLGEMLDPRTSKGSVEPEEGE